MFKFKKRKGYKRTRGHRQQLTKVRITAVGSEKWEKAAKVEAEKPEAEEAASEE